jgi:ADP-heptose:LPS heptosyltransferase
MDVKNRNLFRITRFILLKLPAIFRLLSPFRKKGNKRILIIKTDAIGDYILFRNFLEVIKNSDIYRDHQIDLLGNPLWADVTRQYDAPFVNEYFFADTEKFYDDPLKMLRLGWQFFKKNYAAVLLPAYSRTFLNDGLAALALPKKMIGFTSDTERIDAKYKRKTDKFYNQLVELPADCYFEFDRTKYFFETALNQKLPINGPHLDCGKPRSNHVVIFPGAGVVKRSWERDKFLDLIRLMITHTQYPVYLAGGPAERDIAEYLVTNLPERITNLTAKTTLPQLIELIGTASLVISNETSAVHIAAATQTPAICILGGGHFGRFAPYPDHITFKPVCVYHKMECFNCNWNCIYETEPSAPYPCVGNVSVEQVWTVAESILS